MRKVSVLALQKAAQVWCRPETSHIAMDAKLATAFAIVLDEIWSEPWLGNATTKQLLDEIAARVNLDYKTVEEN